MNKFQKQQFLKRVEAKYCVSTVESGGYAVITEADIFNCIKNLPGIQMLPGTYEAEMPHKIMDIATRNPWGPTVSFEVRKFIPNVNIDCVENAIKTKLGHLIMRVDAIQEGGETFEIKITQNPVNR